MSSLIKLFLSTSLNFQDFHVRSSLMVKRNDRESSEQLKLIIYVNRTHFLFLTLCYAIFLYVMLYYVMLCSAMLCYAMLCHATLRYATLRYVMLCMLCYCLFLFFRFILFYVSKYVWWFIGTLRTHVVKPFCTTRL